MEDIGAVECRGIRCILDKISLAYFVKKERGFCQV